MQEKTNKWISSYTLFLAALGLGAATHSRGENLTQMLQYVEEQKLPIPQKLALFEARNRENKE